MRRTEDVETERRSFDRVTQDQILEAVVGLIQVAERSLHAHLECLFDDRKRGRDLIFGELVVHRELNRVKVEIEQNRRAQVGFVI